MQSNSLGAKKKQQNKVLGIYMYVCIVHFLLLNVHRLLKMDVKGTKGIFTIPSELNLLSFKIYSLHTNVDTRYSVLISLVFHESLCTSWHCVH